MFKAHTLTTSTTTTTTLLSTNTVIGYQTITTPFFAMLDRENLM